MRLIRIPITDDGTVCNTGYVAEYKLTSDSEYTRLFPDPTGTPILFTNMLDDSEYDIRVYRKCCNGNLSASTTTVVDTTIP